MPYKLKVYNGSLMIVLFYVLIEVFQYNLMYYSAIIIIVPCALFTESLESCRRYRESDEWIHLLVWLMFQKVIATPFNLQLY